jgi:hypothetical protein
MSYSNTSRISKPTSIAELPLEGILIMEGSYHGLSKGDSVQFRDDDDNRSIGVVEGFFREGKHYDVSITSQSKTYLRTGNELTKLVNLNKQGYKIH